MIKSFRKKLPPSEVLFVCDVQFDARIGEACCGKKIKISDYVHTVPAKFENGKQFNGTKLFACVHKMPLSDTILKQNFFLNFEKYSILFLRSCFLRKECCWYEYH